MSVLCCALLSAAAEQSKVQADRVVIVKSERTLTLQRGGKVLKRYKVALGTNTVGPKTRQGDGKTPEGLYTIDSRNLHSQFHRSLHVSYPNAADRTRAARLKVSPGGDIMIHGLPPAYAYLGPLHRQSDWTLGCIAVTDAEIDEIWELVPNGTVVEIKP
ncbi:MAG TPA: L,D-transpeptidase family protein [Candidatus Angelobacter sp.]|nr:L,D-transpeptidase family protein [Candidatus Angelobacter sp.]